MSIKENVEKVRKLINENAICESPLLVAVTKTRSIEQMKQITACGIRDLGENRVQELLEKYEHFDDTIRWHLIGSLQQNKVKYIIGKVFLVHSVDSVALMEKINTESKKSGVITDILLETNVSKEESKHGFDPDELPNALYEGGKLKSIRIKGLMMMAPNHAEKDYLVELFTKTQNIFTELMKETAKYDNIEMKYLSMGMSSDFCEALNCGSNMVRLGTILFS